MSIYGLFIRIAALRNAKAAMLVAGRRNWKEKLAVALKNNTREVIWFHCASLGEFEQARPLLDKLKKEDNNRFILLTFFSSSGYNVRKNYPLADYVCYLPADTAANAAFFVDTAKPLLAVFVKYEFWYHFLHKLETAKVPHILISAVFNEEQFLFGSTGKFLLERVRNYTHIFVQDYKSVKLLAANGIERVTQAGDTRFDRVLENAANRKPLPEIEQFKQNQKLLVIGSAWPEDMEVLLPFINSGNCKIVLAPHEIEKEMLEEWQHKIKPASCLYSEITSQNIADVKVLLIDNIGMLASLYSYADVAYVGGAFRTGLHNILEPAVFGIPVVFGPNIKRFPEAIALINEGGSFSISNEQECTDLLHNLINNELTDIGSPNAHYIETHKGATVTIYKHIQQHI